MLCLLSSRVDCSIRLKRISILGLVLASSCLRAQSLPTPLEAGYVYSVESPRGKAAFLFGSDHAGYTKIPVRMGRCAKDLLAQSSTVVMEASRAQATEFMQSRPRTRPMSEVLPLLSEAEVARMGHLAPPNPKDKAPDNRLASLDAFEAFNRLSGNRTQRALALLGGPDFGLDVEVFMAARFLGLKIEALESPQEQFAFAQAIPAAVFADQFSHVLAAMEREPAQSLSKKILAFQRAIATGDERVLVTMPELIGESAAFYDALAIQRNPSQARKIEALLAGESGKPLFIALGALHLPGEKGVPALLAARGHRVKRLCAVAEPNPLAPE